MNALPRTDEACSKSKSGFSPGTNSYVTELDVQLMCRVREGDLHAFSMLMERNRRPLVAFLYRLVQTRFTAEDLAQEVFLRVYRARASYEPTAKFTTWLFRIASHTAINWLRDQCRQKQESLESSIGRHACHQYSDGKPTIEETLLADVKRKKFAPPLLTYRPHSAQRSFYIDTTNWDIARLPYACSVQKPPSRACFTGLMSGCGQIWRT